MYLPIIFGNFHFKPYILIGYLNVEVRVREAQVRCLTLTRMLFVFINISPAFRNISKNFINTVTVVVKILATARLTTVSCRARKCGASVLPGSWLCFYCYFCRKFKSDVHKHRLEGAIFMHVERTNQSAKLSNYKQFVSIFLLASSRRTVTTLLLYRQCVLSEFREGRTKSEVLYEQNIKCAIWKSYSMMSDLLKIAPLCRHSG